MAGKPKKKKPEWYLEQMERSRRFRELILKNNERYYAAKAVRDQRGDG